MSKINEIAEQAGLHLTGRVVHCTTENLTKFAELIVRECAEIADTAEPFLASDLIKEHFGVKE